jgi:NAD(P)-dependent dehydrogenase (short-subunit alcohol dehydrogenase family)
LKKVDDRMLQLENRKILITGATRGLGADLALLLAAQGADIAILGRDAAAGEALAGQIRALGRQAIVLAADVADEPAMLAAGAEAIARFGRIDRLLCVAGLSSPRKPVCETSAAEFHGYFDVNVLGAVLAMRAVLPSMVQHADGRIVLIGGTYGYKGVANSSLYVATKWALRGLAKSVALEVGKHAITVNIVAPGGVDGPRLRDEFAASARREGIAPEAVHRRFTERSALGSLVNSQDIGRTVIHLFGEGGRMITGQDIVIDAGTVV